MELIEGVPLIVTAQLGFMMMEVPLRVRPATIPVLLVLMEQLAIHVIPQQITALCINNLTYAHVKPDITMMDQISSARLVMPPA